MNHQAPARRIARLLAAFALIAGWLAAAAPAAMASPVAATRQATGYLRLAHLSPNAPAVDVYLYSVGNSSAMVVVHHVDLRDRIDLPARPGRGLHGRDAGGREALVVPAGAVHDRPDTVRPCLHGGRHGTGGRAAAAGARRHADHPAGPVPRPGHPGLAEGAQGHSDGGRPDADEEPGVRQRDLVRVRGGRDLGTSGSRAGR